MRLRSVALAVGAMISFASAAAAIERLSDDQLDEARGGYLNANGLTFDFGVQVETWVDGSLALRSALSVTAEGAKAAVLSSTSGPVGTDGAVAAKLVLPGNDGVTTLLQDLSQQSVRNVVLNTASDRTVAQHVDLTIAMPNLPQLQQSMSIERLARSLDQALGAALVNANSH